VENRRDKLADQRAADRQTFRSPASSGDRDPACVFPRPRGFHSHRIVTRVATFARTSAVSDRGGFPRSPPHPLPPPQDSQDKREINWTFLWPPPQDSVGRGRVGGGYRRGRVAGVLPCKFNWLPEFISLGFQPPRRHVSFYPLDPAPPGPSATPSPLSVSLFSSLRPRIWISSFTIDSLRPSKVPRA